MRKLITLLLIFVMAVFLGADVSFAEGKPPEYYIDESKLPFDALPGTSTDRYWGIHKGAGYRIEVPHDWNGDLNWDCCKQRHCSGGPHQ